MVCGHTFKARFSNWITLFNPKKYPILLFSTALIVTVIETGLKMSVNACPNVAYKNGNKNNGT